MPNPYHFRANIDRLARYAHGPAPAYRRLDALDAIVREMYARTERARLNYQMYLATDPFDVARHLLRDLHDRCPVPPLPLGEACPALDAGGWGEGSPTPTEDEPPEEVDDPL